MRRIFLLLVALGLVAAGCGGGDNVSIDNPWARNSPMTANAGAVYMDISSDDGDVLMSAAVDSSIAGMVQIHEVVPVEDTSEDTEEGMATMMMQEVPQVAVPAGETLSLKPGSYHIMLMNIAAPLEIGQKFDVTLNFETAGEQVVEVEVLEEAP